MINKSLAIGIVFLFIVSSTIPMVIGYETKTIMEERLPTLVSDGPMDSPWPMKCHDNRHTGRSPFSTADNNGAELWRFKTEGLVGSVEGGPVVDNDGVIYFGCFDTFLYALYPDGSLKWKYDTGEGWIWSAPAIGDDGTIYVGSYDGFLYSLYPNGTLKWSFKAGTFSSISSSPAIAKDGTVYFGVMGPEEIGRIYAVNPDGTEKWHYDTNYWITSDPAIGDDGTVYIGSGDTYLYAMYPNGTLRWRFKTGHYVKGPPSIDEDGIIYFGSYDSYLYALYPDGSLKWKCKVGTGTETNPSIGSDGTIYVGDDKLYAINPDGTIKWSFDLGSNRCIHQSSPAVSADGIIYVGTNIGEMSGGELIAVNPDGTERWRRNIANKWVESSPCIGQDGIVYIGSSLRDEEGYSYGCLYAFGAGEVNNPPETPTITGPSSGKISEKHMYTISALDPDGHNISYYIDWGDGTDSGWIGAYISGEEISLNHTWSTQGKYTINAKAKDELDAESDWATLEVSMPKNNILSGPLYKFFQNHPRLFPLFRHWLGLQR